MSERVYIVRGDTGEYSDFQMWDVAAFHSEDNAKALAARLNGWLTLNKLHRDQNNAGGYRSSREEKPPEDPGFQCDYTGAKYEVWSIEVKP